MHCSDGDRCQNEIAGLSLHGADQHLKCRPYTDFHSSAVMPIRDERERCPIHRITQNQGSLAFFWPSGTISEGARAAAGASPA